MPSHAVNKTRRIYIVHDTLSLNKPHAEAAREGVKEEETPFSPSPGIHTEAHAHTCDTRYGAVPKGPTQEIKTHNAAPNTFCGLRVV